MATVGRAGRLSAADARLPAYAIPADEERVIAQDTLTRVAAGGNSPARGPAGPAKALTLRAGAIRDLS